jgi:hypothetical protein
MLTPARALWRHVTPRYGWGILGRALFVTPNFPWLTPTEAVASPNM